MALMVQLKSQLFEQKGQNEVLSQQILHVEAESRHAIKELERKQCELESINGELLLVKKLQSGFQPLPLPEGASPSSSDVITSLNEQLLHTLYQLHSHKDALREARGALEKLQRKFAVVIHQQGVLYLEYRDERRRWDEKQKNMVAEMDKLSVKQEENKLKAQELEVYIHILKGELIPWPIHDRLRLVDEVDISILYSISRLVWLEVKRGYSKNSVKCPGS